MNRTLKVSLFCAGLFACGVVAGGFATLRFGQKFRGPGPDGFGPQTMKRLTAELDLSEAQRASIDPIIEQTWSELRVLRRESMAKSTEVIEAMDAGVAAQLTPDQREKFGALKEAQRMRMKKAWEERQKRRDEGGDRERRGGGRSPEGDERGPMRPPPPGS
jgi:Spy/CpxP family protein refolding chaperone